jgi:hypothetical protein
MFSCGRCGRRESCWKPHTLCAACQRQNLREHDRHRAGGGESLRDFRRRLSDPPQEG